MAALAFSSSAVAGFQIRRDLVPKTRKTCANPAVLPRGPSHEAPSVLEFAGRELHRYSVSRSKGVRTITAAYPTPQKYSTDIPEFTNITITNNLNQRISLRFKNFWEGKQSTITELDKIVNIEKGTTAEYKHEAAAVKSVIGSAGGLEYHYQLEEGEGEGKKWIIAWSNSKNELNKVYSKIVKAEETVDWDEIQNKLLKSNNEFGDKDEETPFSLEIDATSSKAEFKAKIGEKQSEEKPAGTAGTAGTTGSQ